MVRKDSSQKSLVKPIRGANGQPVQNKILLGLPAVEAAVLFAKLEFVPLPVRTVLNEIDQPIEFAFFINDGLASVLSIMKNGKSVEVGLCGTEGFIGLPLLAGFNSSPTRVIMQVAGSAFRISAANLIAVLQKSPKLAMALQRSVQELGLQSAQVAACNRLHEVEERLARWLLMSQDRLGGDLVPLTQEFLAHMLGTRRASVTEAAGILQKAGLIIYSRGSVKIEKRSQLEKASCECYRTLTRQVEKWQAESN
jgi:CRP-like cAMP-binding protein